MAAAWAGARRARSVGGVSRLLMIGLLAASMWPLMHTLSAQIASSFKHVWMGLLLAAPATGYAASEAWRRAGPRLRFVATVGLIGFAAVEWVALEPMTYPRFQPSADFLLDAVGDDETVFVLGDNDRWVYAMFLYGEGLVDAPSDVLDQARTVSGDPCAYDWIVATSRASIGPVDTGQWGCTVELAFESRQRFLNHRGQMDIQRFEIWKRM